MKSTSKFLLLALCFCVGGMSSSAFAQEAGEQGLSKEADVSAKPVREGKMTVAVFEILPAANESTVPVAVNVTEVPTNRFTVSSMWPSPEVLEQTPPPEQVQVTSMISDGKVSRTRAPATFSGPLLVTSMV